MKKKPGGDAPKGKKKEPDASFRPFGALKALKQELEAREAKAVDAKPAPPKRAPPAPPPPSDEDEALALYRMMNGVTPLAGKSARRVPRSQSELARSELEARKKQAEAPIKAEDEQVHAHLRALVEGGRFEVSDDGRRVEGRRQGITPDVARKLRRGMFPVDARLDLHGETASSGQKALEAFLKLQRSRGERCVLVIHGKGDHSPRGVGVLRGEIAAWLSQGAASPHVAAFTTATEADGGEGAVYILLTR